MTPEEIQALREKHAPRTIGVADFRTIDHPEHHKTIIACNICTVGENGKVLSYPCDVIKVLDAYWVGTQKAFGEGHAAGFDKAWTIAKSTSFADAIIQVLDAWEAERTMNVAPLINAYLKTNVYTNLYTNEDYDL